MGMRDFFFVVKHPFQPPEMVKVRAKDRGHGSCCETRDEALLQHRRRLNCQIRTATEKITKAQAELAETQAELAEYEALVSSGKLVERRMKSSR